MGKNNLKNLNSANVLACFTKGNTLHSIQKTFCQPKKDTGCFGVQRDCQLGPFFCIDSHWERGKGPISRTHSRTHSTK
jgi:hypothetical protein